MFYFDKANMLFPARSGVPVKIEPNDYNNCCPEWYEIQGGDACVVFADPVLHDYCTWGVESPCVSTNDSPLWQKDIYAPSGGIFKISVSARLLSGTSAALVAFGVPNTAIALGVESTDWQTETYEHVIGAGCTSLRLRIYLGYNSIGEAIFSYGFI